jgi:outer membrane receptor for ferrienterochelin and colicins
LYNSVKMVLVLAIVAICQTVYAQKGGLYGEVKDDSSSAMADVYITLKGTSFKTFTDQEGKFALKNVPAGKYQLVATGLCNHELKVPVVVPEGKDTFIVVSVRHRIAEADEVVITATRTEKEVLDVATPIKVISGAQIAQMGSLRLNEVLQEQTGLAIVSDHGTGIQMQGFNPDYTLILLNGEPMIGRTAGTLDLTRIAVGNIKKIEIVKGPSSSLYGSEALAGVINIITETPKDGLKVQVRPRYSTGKRGYNVFDLSGDVGYRYKKFGAYVFANRYQSMGYDLQPQSKEKTVPPFNNHTFQTRLSYDFTPKTSLVLNARYFGESSKAFQSFTENGNTYNIDMLGEQYDWNINPVLTHRYNARLRHIFRYYSTNYHTKSDMINLADGSLYDKSFFNQSFNRPETQLDYFWDENNLTTGGVGVTFESVNATRYTEGKHFNNIYGYLQHDFRILRKVNVIVGARYDNHSVYGDRLSPKISTLYRPVNWIALKASAGQGFKAPDFRQLYLNFANPVAGYNVFGSEEAQHQLQLLQNQGQVSQVLIDPSILGNVKAEYSTAYNVGFTLTPHRTVTWNVNGFYNDIKDLIETGAIALKTNGQAVYSYYNQAQIFTRGIETDLTLKPMRGLSVSVGYQYMEAKNREVLKGLDEGQYFARDPETLETVRLTRADYGGLYNRSKHMANARLFYMNNRKGYGASIRCIYRGKYGFGDSNGNNILDHESEYVKGYFLWNVSASKKILKIFNLQAGIDNVFDYVNPTYIPSVPGRIYYVSLNIELRSK